MTLPRALRAAPLALLWLLWLPACGDDDTPSGDGGIDAAPPVCGNAVVEGDEECDDGNDDNSDGCCRSCLLCDPCTVSAWSRCTPGQDLCCPTTEHTPTECAPHASSADAHRCLPSCSDAADCYWSNNCGSTFPDHCWPAYCGESYGSEIQGPCTVGDATGYCYPLGLAEDEWGLCVEPGSLPAGAPCEGGHPIDEIPRGVDTCADGLCVAWVDEAQPRCLSFCDPVRAYDASAVGAAACQPGFNCLSMAYVSSYSHKRTADKGWCVPTPSTDASGLLSCDLISGGLIADRSALCDDLLPGSHCTYWRSGSLMGVCDALDATPLALGDPCDSEAEAPPCAEGLLCRGLDPFGPGDATDHHCLQVCDAADPSWVCDATGLVCTSLSVAFFTVDATTDASPTRLGLCAPAPSVTF